MRFLILLFISSTINAQVDDSKILEIVEVLKEVETNNNPTKIGDNGRAKGVLQIHKICVDDVNKHYRLNFTHNDMFNINKSEKVAFLYLKKGVEVFKRKYKRHPTEEQVVRMFNGSIYSGYKKDSTKKYYNRYLKFKNN